MGHPERRFYFELAESLGCTVSELLDRITSAELTEWKALAVIRSQERDSAERRSRMGR